MLIRKKRRRRRRKKESYKKKSLGPYFLMFYGAGGTGDADFQH